MGIAKVGNSLQPQELMAAIRRAQLGAFFRPSQLEHAGLTYYQLQQLTTAGLVEKVARGLYRLADKEPTENYSLAAVCARIPRAIVCLITALRVHEIGTSLSRDVWIAIPYGDRMPQSPAARIRVVRFNGAALRYGVVTTTFEGVAGRITNPARTILDCFRFERLVSRETALEALREGLRRRLVTTDALYRAMEVLPSRRLRQVLEAGTL